MITTGWLERIIERNKAVYEEKKLAEARAREEARARVLVQARAEGHAEVLAVLDEDTRKVVERKLRRKVDHNEKIRAEGRAEVLAVLGRRARAPAQRRFGTPGLIPRSP